MPHAAHKALNPSKAKLRSFKSCVYYSQLTWVCRVCTLLLHIKADISELTSGKEEYETQHDLH